MEDMSLIELAKSFQFGRDADAFLATKLFGWKWVSRNRFNMIFLIPPEAIYPNPESEIAPGALIADQSKLPYFTTDLSDLQKGEDILFGSGQGSLYVDCLFQIMGLELGQDPLLMTHLDDIHLMLHHRPTHAQRVWAMILTCLSAITD